MNSMTGMGRARGKLGLSFLLVEIKSFNHRYCEVHTRLPSNFQVFELPIIQAVRKKISRGKLEVGIFEERKEGEFTFSKKSLKNYHRFLNTVKNELKLGEPISITHIQNGQAYWMARENDVKNRWPVLKKLLDHALTKLVLMRKKEGGHLKAHLEAGLGTLSAVRKNVAEKSAEMVQAVKQRLENRIEKLLLNVEIDESRLANEVAFFADKSDISEELARLSSHFIQVEKLLKSAGPCGRELDFLIQELNREWNTIASKSQSAVISQLVTGAKSGLEKMREQVQNIE